MPARDRGRRQDAAWRDGEDGAAVKLLAAFDHTHGVVLAQRGVDAASNEISAFGPLLEGLDLAGAIVTADALHTQRAHASFLVSRHADYVLVVKANQPALHAQLAWLPWREVPVMDRTRDQHTAGSSCAPSRSPRWRAWGSHMPPKRSASPAACVAWVAAPCAA